jgi:hypothetical protein
MYDCTIIFDEERKQSIRFIVATKVDVMFLYGLLLSTKSIWRVKINGQSTDDWPMIKDITNLLE